MAKVEIAENLKKEIFRKFKGESIVVFKLMRSLEKNSTKGKIVGMAGGLLIKELKYKSFRFYFIVDGNRLKLFSKEELLDLLIMFVRMSDKKSQQKVINEIKDILGGMRDEGF